MNEYLLVRLEAPLTSFGGVVVDNYGAEMAFPAPSMITGLLANALGYRRHDFERLQALQDRLRMCVRIDRDGLPIQDYQTVEMHKDDKAWTTRGEPESRDGGPKNATYTHIRYRDFHADRSVLIALWLEPIDESPTLAEIQSALRQPQRPLFIGRKPCIPAAYLDVGLFKAATPTEALAGQPPEFEDQAVLFEPLAPDAPQEPDDLYVSGLRNWNNQVHGGQQRWRQRRWLQEPAQ